MNDLEIVVATQEYIKTHHNDVDFSIENVCNAVGYSRRQLDRLFRKYMQTTLYEYINAVVLSESAVKLINTDNKILDIALDSHYNTHEGYSRSFTKKVFRNSRRVSKKQNRYSYVHTVPSKSLSDYERRATNGKHINLHRYTRKQTEKKTDLSPFKMCRRLFIILRRSGM